MKVLGVVSDTHDNVPLARTAAAFFHEQGVDSVLHLGDITSPAIVEVFRRLPVRFLRGNNDSDPRLDKALAQAHLPPLEDEWADEVAGVRIGAAHGHRDAALGRLAARSHLVLHGHTHRRRAERLLGALVVNPGALHRAPTKSVALVELPALRVRFVEVRVDGTRPIA